MRHTNSPTRKRNPLNHCPAGFRSVLCPIDFSEQSRRALQFGAAIACQSGGRLSVLFVDDPLLLAATAAAYPERGRIETSPADLRAFATASLPPAARRAISTTYHVAVGKPANEIDRWARGHDCDLIVMSTEGLGGSHRLVFGSTTRGVLRRAAAPVLVVPPAADVPRVSRHSLQPDQVPVASLD